jgi:hypothetical protein
MGVLKDRAKWEVAPERWELNSDDNEAVSLRVVEAKFFRNNFQVYRFTAPSLLHACERIAEYHRKLMSLNVVVKINGRSDVDKNVLARPVYYREFPAIIADFDGEKGCVLVRSDTPGTLGFPVEPWDKDSSKSSRDDNIWEDLLSPHIHWHREE